MVSFQSICEYIWDRERRDNLFAIKINDVFIWQIIRFKTYQQIPKKIGIFNEQHPKSKSKTKFDIHDLAMRAKHVFTSNPYWAFWKKSSVVIMPHTRQVEGIDIYTNDIIKKIDNPLILYRDYKGEHYKNSYTMDIVYLTFFIINAILKITGLKSFYCKKNDLLHSLEKDILDTFGCHVPVNSMAYNALLIFKTDYFFYKLLFRLKSTQTLYIINAYSNCGVIKAARDCGVHVVELQHGIFTRYHLGYSYPDNNNVPDYCPHEIWCYGQFWIEDTPLPSSIKTLVYGFPYLTNLLQHYQKPKTKGLVLFASQGPTSEKLFEFAQNFAVLRQDLQIIYRLHPSEILRDYEVKFNKSDYKNFRLSSKDVAGEPSTYTLMAEAEFQISVSSTTLLEGIYLGCKIAVVALPGHEYMRGVIARGDAILIENPQDLADKIDDIKPVADASFYYSE